MKAKVPPHHTEMDNGETNAVQIHRARLTIDIQ